MPAGGNVLDSLWIALGIKVEGDGLTQVKAQVNEARESLLSAGAALKTFIAGFAIHEIAKIGSTFEQNQIQIAGFLSALGSSSDFNAGLKDAQGVIQQITKDAAILPGEAQEYIDVFKAGFPFVKAAMPAGAGLHDITNFTNQLTAIGKTFGLDSGLIAREFDHMLSPGKGMASLRLPLFRQLLAFMPTLKNGARQTAESFNAMTAPERLKVLQGTFSKLQPMLDASATSFDAMWGAAVSAVKQMTRMATAPLFKGMKVALDQINGAFYDTNGELTDFGKGVVDAIGTATKYFTQFLGMIGHVVMWIAKSKGGAIALKIAIGLLGTALAGLALQKTIGSFTKLLGVLTNLRALMGGALFIAIGLIAEDLYQFYTGGDSVTGLLVARFGPALKTVSDTLTDMMHGLRDVGRLLSSVFNSPTGGLGDVSDDLRNATGLFGLLIEKIGITKDVVVTAAAVMGIALFAAFAPVTAALTSLTALITMLEQLKNHKGFFNDRVRSISDSLGKHLGLDIAGDRSRGMPDMGGAGVMSGTDWSPAGSGSVPSWSPADSGGGVGPLVSPATTTTVDSHDVMNFNVVSPEPEAAARKVAAVIRNNRSKVHH